ncbi:hypothetical protein MSG28_011931 [Choristoneura fumiferana]|uniref:Uncharacterized protein n=1 Tax=Choristoneura fumiferana TaxID=7141 RepID=A0ACC0KN00_CHOFU|nr:hypothetical protein MSG28_011931 [Choristoneura fumiferana]
MASVRKIKVILLFCCLVSLAVGHGPPPDRDSEDIAMGRKVQKVPPRRPESMSAKWCSMAKVCNHDRVPICGLSHAGDVMGFRDLCDMFDYNCIRRRSTSPDLLFKSKSSHIVSQSYT